MRTSYRLLSGRSGVRLSPGARSNSTTVPPATATCVANQSAKSALSDLRALLTSPWFAVGKGLFLCLLLAVLVGSLNLVGHFEMPERATDEQIMQIRPPAEGPPAARVADRGCWTGEAPADMQGVIPGHVVVTVDGVARVGGTGMVTKALAQIFDGADYGLRVHGFCR